MKIHPIRTCLAVMSVAFMGITMPAWAAGDKNDVVAKLSAQKVIVQPGGKQIFQSAEKARPGDIIDYQAVYHNQGKAGIKNLIPTMPIPIGMEYLPSSAKPAPASASLDGQNFSALPLKRLVKLPNGKEELRDVPYQEYRYLRWNLGDLAAGRQASVNMRARMSVSAGAVVTETNGGQK